MGFELGETYSGYKFLDVTKRLNDCVEYRVQNTWAQRVELLRALPQTGEDGEQQTDRFLREMRVRARLVHPNIVTLLNALELDHHLIMTTEVVEGQTLADRLQQGPIPWREAAALMRQALAAAGCAHQQKIVHRDIQPENILLARDGVLKLTNFGLAKGADSPQLTQVGLVVGSLWYISPEQVKGLADVDARSDIYSLGIVFYEMLCGRPPFASSSQFELMTAHVQEAPKAPSEFRKGFPTELDAVVLKALAKDPAERYQTAAEFDQAIVDVINALDHPHVDAVPMPSANGTGASPVPELPVPATDRLPAPPEPAVAKERRPIRPSIIYCGVAAIVCALLTALWLLLVR
jgi:serine/threonine-protein kinase